MNIWVAASDGRQELVEKFLNENPSLSANTKDPNGYTPVHAAAAYGHHDLLRKLCSEYNGDVNIRDADGDTPLHHCEDVNTARLIIEELNGDFSLVNNEGKTALQVFEEDGEFPELIEYMRVKSGIPIEQDSFGIDKEQLGQFKDSIRYTLENEPEEPLDEESLQRRKRLEEIIQGDNAEQELENYIRELVRSQILTGGDSSAADESSTKRRR
ncbi:hypothetical protein KAFR_0J02500 [Kazachstania africana CBS 2517]|uniref:Uncharacterized protein n=1 Tax=Kazachstania africana (strain ATCC 22294 / BCRC 22015 / CBS 2517 / CECT 1963 / NBRC 1671 / NRRL Y-8276) TaxID=1071382 RepID=H2B114_KAZAF|nr:hypothetical protein KAFR_0J02500 [Kazachstania africana CBS 2517]CCF60314.1 hypothetical protein KAFR_0J02500 [Kazachstania africana CBS 2517]